MLFSDAAGTTGGLGLSDLISTTISPLQVLLTLVLALAVGIFIFLIYKKTFAGVMYSRNFNISLIMLTLVTSLMLMLINNSLVLSLGMVGALSIIRFRTAVKDPIDTVFMFWAVGEGIAVGTRFYDVAIISAISIGVFLIIISLVRFRSTESYLLIIHYHESAGSVVKQFVAKLPKTKLKSKTVQRDGIEMTLELRLKDSETGFVDKLLKIEGVYDATLISHHGDMAM
ncbi:MAG: DUF4956 domain-containing protein [Candidatus Gastranaerophilaceae bacterium]|nr:hypothetical protein [Christensenellales bacterium]